MDFMEVVSYVYNTLSRFASIFIEVMKTKLLTLGGILMPIGIALSLIGVSFGGTILWLYELFAALCIVLGLYCLNKGFQIAKIADNTAKTIQENNQGKLDTIITELREVKIVLAGMKDLLQIANNKKGGNNEQTKEDQEREQT